MYEVREACRVCVVWGSEVRQYFEISRGLRQGGVMFPYLVNIFFERMVRRMNERAEGRGMKLRDKNGRGW